MPPSEMSGPSFVGRDLEVDTLRQAVERSPALVLVEGEAGVGKSRLLQEFVRSSPRDRHLRVGLASCPPYRQSLTLGPVVDAIRQTRRDIETLCLSDLAGALRPIFPEWAHALPPAPEPLEDASAARHRLFHALAEVIEVLDLEVLAVEDVHWADEATLEFLLFLMSRPRGDAPAIVLTYRPGDVPVDSLLLRLSSRAVRGSRPARVTLKPLDVAATAELVSSMLGGEPVSDAFARFLHQHTDGLPLAIEESLRLLQHRADVVRRDGEWVRRRLENLQVPPTIRDSVVERIARLGDSTRGLLEAAAVLGEPSTDEMLSEVAGVSASDAGPALTEALTSGLLTVDQRQNVAFRHALTAKAVYDAIPWRRRGDLHGRAGELLERARPVAFAELSRHFRETGDADQWARYAERAADLAAESSDFTRAASILYEPVRDPRIGIGVRARLAAKLATYAGQRRDTVDQLHKEVIHTVRTVLAASGIQPRERGAIRNAYSRLLLQCGEFEEGSTELERTLSELGDDPLVAARGMTRLAMPLAGRWPAARHRRWLHRANEQAARVQDPYGRLSLKLDRASALLLLGDEEGWAVAEDLPTTSPSSRVRREIARGQANIGYAAIAWGCYDEARRRLAVASELTDPEYHRLQESVGGLQAELDWCTGAWTGLADRLHALSAETEDDGTIQEVGRALGALHIAAGRLDAADAVLTGMLEQAERLGSYAELVSSSALLARVRLFQGRIEEALELTNEPMQRLQSTQTWLWATTLVPVHVETLLAASMLHRAVEVSADFGRGLHGCSAPAPAAALRTTQALVEEADGDPVRAAAAFELAASAWARLPRPYVATLMHERRAFLLLDSDRREVADGLGPLDALTNVFETLTALGAHRDAERVRRRLRDHGVDVRRPWRGGRKGYGDQLSPREREVVRLVVDGRTNRQIAAQLSRSPSTVATQLRSAMRKLDVSSRTALAASVVESGLDLDG